MTDRLWPPAANANLHHLSAAQAACRGVAVCLLFSGAYAASNALTHARADVIASGVFKWERSIPFVAWTIVP